MEKKKVLLIAPPFIPTSKDSVGGAEQMAFNLGKALSERGHDVYTLARNDSEVFGSLIPVGFQGDTTGNFVSDISIYRQLSALIASSYSNFLQENPDTDVVVDSFNCIGLMREVAVGNGPQVLSRLNVIPRDFLLSSTFEAVKKQLNKPISKSMLVPISQSMLEDYTNAYDFSNYEKELTVVRNSVIADNFKFNLYPDNYVLFIGRIEKEKGTHHAIKAAKENGYKIIIAGGSEKSGGNMFLNKPYYEKEIAPLIDDNVIMYGPADLAQKVELMKNAKAVLTPILWNEPGGLVQLEAMACGTPVICYNRGGPAETIVHGKTGFLANDYHEFVNYLSQVDNISRDACRKHIERNFDYTIMGKNYEALFK